jgi:hypothetical protein
MKITKDDLKKLIKEELTKEMSAPAPMQEAAGGVVYLVGVDVEYEAPNIYGVFSDKKAAIKAAQTLKKDEYIAGSVTVWTLNINNQLSDTDILFDNVAKV